MYRTFYSLDNKTIHDITCETRQDYLDILEEIKKTDSVFVKETKTKENVRLHIFRNQNGEGYDVKFCECVMKGSDELFYIL